ncbi:MAG: hypothetical protein K2Y23_18840 [Cyanobacteria bacterium]|nr:hypothetical protein [Cyanobacteriota bacterium]
MSQALVRKMVSVLAVVATTALLAVIITPAPALATSFSCQQTGSCPNQASCEGTNVVRDGCTIQCLVPLEGNTSGELVNAGSATCGAGGGGGGDDGGGDWWCGTYCW